MNHGYTVESLKFVGANFCGLSIFQTGSWGRNFVNWLGGGGKSKDNSGRGYFI